MAQTKRGSVKASKTMKRKYGRDYYQRIGRLGGQVGRKGGFAYMRANGQMEKLRAAASLGGKISRPSSEKAEAL